MHTLTDKVALITGAGRGMGKAHAIALAKAGATVVITDIDLDACRVVMQAVNEECDSESACFRLDVSNKQEVDDVIDGVISQYGRLDILVNNAGVYTPVAALELSEDEWSRTLDTNVKGQFLCAQRAAKEMAINGWGRIINIASVSSGQVGIGLSGGAHYAASKGAVIAMTESLAAEWAHLGINVNAIAPGLIDTDMSRARRLPKEDMDVFLKHHIPLGRIGKPEEVSPLVVLLASEDASYITGSTFYVDGGWLAA